MMQPDHRGEPRLAALAGRANCYAFIVGVPGVLDGLWLPLTRPLGFGEPVFPREQRIVAPPFQ
jgi:hypothetical protein